MGTCKLSIVFVTLLSTMTVAGYSSLHPPCSAAITFLSNPVSFESGRSVCHRPSSDLYSS